MSEEIDRAGVNAETVAQELCDAFGGPEDVIPCVIETILAPALASEREEGRLAGLSEALVDTDAPGPIAALILGEGVCVSGTGSGWRVDYAPNAPCTCGSGGHPRRCPVHPHAFELNIESNVTDGLDGSWVRAETVAEAVKVDRDRWTLTGPDGESMVFTTDDEVVVVGKDATDGDLSLDASPKYTGSPKRTVRLIVNRANGESECVATFQMMPGDRARVEREPA